MFALLCMWFLISFPLVWIGVWLGYRRTLSEPPVKTNLVPRVIPSQVGRVSGSGRTLVSLGGLSRLTACRHGIFICSSRCWWAGYCPLAPSSSSSTLSCRPSGCSASITSSASSRSYCSSCSSHVARWRSFSHTFSCAMCAWPHPPHPHGTSQSCRSPAPACDNHAM